MPPTGSLLVVLNNFCLREENTLLTSRRRGDDFSSLPPPDPLLLPLHPARKDLCPQRLGFPAATRGIPQKLPPEPRCGGTAGLQDQGGFRIPGERGFRIPGTGALGSGGEGFQDPGDRGFRIAGTRGAGGERKTAQRDP